MQDSSEDVGRAEEGEGRCLKSKSRLDEGGEGIEFKWGSIYRRPGEVELCE